MKSVRVSLVKWAIFQLEVSVYIGGRDGPQEPRKLYRRITAISQGVSSTVNARVCRFVSANVLLRVFMFGSYRDLTSAPLLNAHRR